MVRGRGGKDQQAHEEEEEEEEDREALAGAVLAAPQYLTAHPAGSELVVPPVTAVKGLASVSVGFFLVARSRMA